MIYYIWDPGDIGRYVAIYGYVIGWEGELNALNIVTTSEIQLTYGHDVIGAQRSSSLEDALKRETTQWMKS